MAKSLRQQVLDLCELHGCSLYDFSGSHFAIASDTFNDARTWITNSHSLTAYADYGINDAYRDLIDFLKQGFVDNGSACDDGDACDICEALGRS